MSRNNPFKVTPKTEDWSLKIEPIKEFMPMDKSSFLDNAKKKRFADTGLRWITNALKGSESQIPAREGVEHIEGDPLETELKTVDQLKKEGYVGIHIRIPYEEYYSRPIVTKDS
jgi:hypothetical protein